MANIRHRSIVDNRHNIRDPYGPGPDDMAIWVNTVLKERVSDLFRTQQGVGGHAIQIEQELNRLARIEGKTGAAVVQAQKSARFISDSIKKAQADSHFGVHWRYHH